MTDDGVPLERRLAGRIAARSEIRDVRLLKSRFETHSLPSPSSRMIYDLDKVTAVDYSDGDNFFVVTIDYHLKIAEAVDADSDDVDDAPLVADIEFQIGSLFRLQMKPDDDPPKTEELEAYGATTGQFAVHPFAREYIYDITGRLSLPPLTIGLLQLTYATEQRD